MTTDSAREHVEDRLDETIEETFPASDPPANTVETGIALGSIGWREGEVIDNRAASRFELRKDGEIAFLEYERRSGTIVFVHTEVPHALAGQGIANALAKAGLETGRADGFRIVAVCPFVRAYLRKHPEAAT